MNGPVGLTPEQQEAPGVGEAVRPTQHLPSGARARQGPRVARPRRAVEGGCRRGDPRGLHARDAGWQRDGPDLGSAGHRGAGRRLQRLRRALRRHHPGVAAHPVVVRPGADRALRGAHRRVLEHRRTQAGGAGGDRTGDGLRLHHGPSHGTHRHPRPQGRRWLRDHGHQGVHLQRLAGQRRHGLRPPRPRAVRRGQPRRATSMVCLALPTDSPGFSVGQIFDKMGQRACPAAELVFDGVFVPEETASEPRARVGSSTARS